MLILGSTGSIGRQALDVAANLPNVRVVGLAAGARFSEVRAQAKACGAAAVAIAEGGQSFAESGGAAAARLFRGPEAALELIAWAAAEAAQAGEPLTVLNGIVGAAGLRATLASLEAGATLALANKESLVVGGELVLAAAARGGGTIIPVDSEHSALFQCLLAARPELEEIPGRPVSAAGRLRIAEELVLTGSGGPFRGRARQALAGVTVADALRHPTWSMGAKITVDSATLMNKGLEVIEAHYLFGVPYQRIRVVIHPQSVVHSLVRLVDGALLAHLGVPDMRVPIGYALSYPERAPLPMVAPLALVGQQLTFEEPDSEVFGCLRLARAAGERGGTAPVVLNAANEVAVQAFLGGRLPFLGIEGVVESTLAQLEHAAHGGLDVVLATDAEARRVAADLARRWSRV